MFCAVCYYTYMQNITYLKRDINEMEALFPCLGEEGQDVYPSVAALQIAREELQAPQDALLVWHLPDVFSVRYGSCYVGAVRYENKEIRFLWENGDETDNFREEDVKWSDPWKA